MQLVGNSAVVTGAASGIGAAVASHLAGLGMQVLGIDLPTSIERAVDNDTSAAVEMATAPERLCSVTLIGADVTSEEDISAALAQLDEVAPLRIVVNCAGIAPASRILTREGPHDLELFRRVVDINLTGTFNVLRLAAEVMAAQSPEADGQCGVIINTASIAAYEGQIGQAAYAASKGGIVALTLAAARDLASRGIRINTIAPGVVETPLLAGLSDGVGEALAAAVPFPPRLATPAEFARLVEMIAEHEYLNGETIRMDGALRLGPR